MGEEGNEFRLNQHESDIKDIKDEVKDVNKSVTNMEKTNIRIEINMQSILDTYKVIKNTTIGFVILNILTMIWTLSKK